MQTSAPQVHIYTEANPNPNSMKFAANFMLVADGSDHDFANFEAAKTGSPLATAIFEQFSFITRVFVMSNFVTLTGDGSQDWHEVNALIRDFIKKYLESGGSILSGKGVTNATNNLQDDAQDSPIVRKIKQLLDEYVRPNVESDGGAINFHSFENGVVRVELRGSCSGCPSSTLTLKSGIENLLSRMIPEVKEVIAQGM